MPSIAEAYKRWRHGRGFGVHSPFAYFMVKEVVRPARGYDYYGYKDIDEAWLNMQNSEHRRSMRRQARILLRLAARLDIHTAFMPKAQTATPFIAALQAANSQITIYNASSDIHKCDLILSARDYVSLEALQSFLRLDNKVLGMRNVPEGWADALFSSLPQGLMLRDHDSLIIVSRPVMQKVAYAIKL